MINTKIIYNYLFDKYFLLELWIIFFSSIKNFNMSLYFLVKSTILFFHMDHLDYLILVFHVIQHYKLEISELFCL